MLSEARRNVLRRASYIQAKATQAEATQAPSSGPRLTADPAKASMVRLPDGRTIPAKEARKWLK